MEDRQPKPLDDEVKTPKPPLKEVPVRPQDSVPPVLRPWERLKVLCVLIVTVIVLIVFIDYQGGKPSAAESALEAHRALMERIRP